MTYITISRRAFWTMKGIMLCFALILAIGCAYFYGEYVKNKCFLADRKDFIEQYRVVQLELQGTTFCYNPEGNSVREATHIKGNLYRVK